MNGALEEIELALGDQFRAELEHLVRAVETFDRLVKDEGIGSIETLTARSNVVIRARSLSRYCKGDQ